MKGYKGMTKDMTCRGMQYEVGKTYHVDGEIALCRNGLHFCEQLYNVFGFYERDNGNRYFEVSADGQIISNDMKSVASKLTIIRELTDIEVNRCIYDNSYNNGYGNSDGYGLGDGYGYGYSYGHGHGFGNGNDDGYGNHHYNCYANSYGNSGCGRGDGYGCENISKILIYEGE